MVENHVSSAGGSLSLLIHPPFVRQLNEEGQRTYFLDNAYKLSSMIQLYFVVVVCLSPTWALCKKNYIKE